MSVFKRMELAVAFAMQYTEAGAIVSIERSSTPEDSDVGVYLNEAVCGIEREYIAEVLAGTRQEEVYSAYSTDTEGRREWVGDIHVYRNGEDVFFFHFYAA